MTRGPARRGPAYRARFLIAGGTAVGLVAVLGLLLAVRAIEPDFDRGWMAQIVEHRSPLWEIPALILDFVGGGWFAILLVPAAAAGAFAIARRPWSGLAFVLASAASFLLVQGLKRVLGRARPEDILLPLESPAFPSGHVANAATVGVVLALLLRRAWVWAVGVAYVVLMALSRTYLGAHWVTDTIGGAVLGAAVALITWAILLTRVDPEGGLERRGRARDASVGT